MTRMQNKQRCRRASKDSMQGMVKWWITALALGSAPMGSSFGVRSLLGRGRAAVQTCHRSPAATAPGALQSTEQQIVSPFDESKEASLQEEKLPTKLGYNLDLTLENVEAVLDELRPYLIHDGGNVVVTDIDGPVVKLELQGACGTCPSSTQTMKMGLERGLKERIPEIQEVIQDNQKGPKITEDQINVVLDGVRPFLDVAGGSIDIDRMEGIDGLQPTIWLHMQGASASLSSVKLEIAQRLQRHFMQPGLHIQWKEEYEAKRSRW